MTPNDMQIITCMYVLDLLHADGHVYVLDLLHACMYVSWESHLKLTECAESVDQAGVGPDTAYYKYKLFAHIT